MKKSDTDTTDTSIHSIKEYLSKITDIQEANKEYKQNQIFFRGQSKFGKLERKIMPSVFREDRKEKENKIYSFAMTECPQDFANCNNHCEILSTMQHYGIPTRLVDITKNALVALYFAIVDGKGAISNKDNGVVFIIGAQENHIKDYDSDTISILASLPRFSYDVQEKIKLKALEPNCDNKIKINEFNFKTEEVRKLLHEIKKEKPQFEPIINPNDVLDNFIFTPQKTNPRIIRQQGSFIIFGLGYDKDQSHESLPEVNNKTNINDSFLKHTPVVLDKIIINQDSKQEILNELKICGITQSSLFPELYKLGEYIRNNGDF